MWCNTMPLDKNLGIPDLHHVALCHIALHRITSRKYVRVHLNYLYQIFSIALCRVASGKCVSEFMFLLRAIFILHFRFKKFFPTPNFLYYFSDIKFSWTLNSLFYFSDLKIFFQHYTYSVNYFPILGNYLPLQILYLSKVCACMSILTQKIFSCTNFFVFLSRLWKLSPTWNFVFHSNL